MMKVNKETFKNIRISAKDKLKELGKASIPFVLGVIKGQDYKKISTLDAELARLHELAKLELEKTGEISFKTQESIRDIERTLRYL